MNPDASSKKGLKLGKRKSQGPLPPGVERRRRLRQERRQERLIQLWRLVFFLLTATGLSWLLLTLGWSLRSASQIQISGSQRMDENVVVNAAGLSFPQSLLTLEPGQIESKLMQELPVQEVSVQRRLLPPGLAHRVEGGGVCSTAGAANAYFAFCGPPAVDPSWIPPRPSLGSSEVCVCTVYYTCSCSGS